MDLWYLWNDSMPTVNTDNYSDPKDLLKDLRYATKDKWSYISTKTEQTQYYEEGTYVGYGFGYSPDADGKLRITYLYDDSEFNDFGIDRAWKINKINGASVDENSELSDLLGKDEIGVSNTFELESPFGDIVNHVFSKRLVTVNTVVYSDVISLGTKKIGYMVFQSFIGPSIDELTKLFADFKSEGINELVIDLRYNGGGQMSVVTHLASLIIPSRLDGQLFLTYEHNSDRSNQDAGINFERNSNSLDLEKVYFIADKGSASASEAIINGLEPYLDVFIVGDNTYGKPVGMYSFPSVISDLVYVPISFKLKNAAGYGDYYEGLKADSYVDDDLTHGFGVSEDIFSEVLHHIENGSFSSKKSGSDIRKKVKEIRSIKDERGSL